MINSDYSLRDYFDAHPEIEVDPIYLEKVFGPRRFEVPPVQISVENPVKVKGKINWQLTACHIQDQLTDMAMHAAARINLNGSQLETYRLAAFKFEDQLAYRDELLRTAAALLEQGTPTLEKPNPGTTRSGQRIHSWTILNFLKGLK